MYKMYKMCTRRESLLWVEIQVDIYVRVSVSTRTLILIDTVDIFVSCGESHLNNTVRSTE